MIVLTFLVRRRPDMPEDEFHRYWREEHGPLVASHAASLGIRRYSQLHATNSAIGVAVAQSRECTPTEWDGAALVWFDGEDALMAAGKTPEGQAAGLALLEDERRFLDLPRCQIFLSTDHAVVG
jgi:uncharacterized protein (TIGR02118 family)